MAQVFGLALKAAKSADVQRTRFVDVLHPTWKRWRCAKLVGVSSHLEQSFACSVRFFDSMQVFDVPLKEVRRLSFATYSLLQAAEARDGAQLVRAMFATVDVVDCVRTSCTLLISLTVGNVNFRREIGSADLIFLLLSMVHPGPLAKPIGIAAPSATLPEMDAELVEHAVRVLMNLACEDENVHMMVSHGAIETLAKAMRRDPSARGVQYASMKTLHNIAVDNPSYRERMREQQIVELIVNAKSQFVDDERLQEWASNSVTAILWQE